MRLIIYFFIVLVFVSCNMMNSKEENDNLKPYVKKESRKMIKEVVAYEISHLKNDKIELLKEYKNSKNFDSTVFKYINNIFRLDSMVKSLSNKKEKIQITKKDINKIIDLKYKLVKNFDSHHNNDISKINRGINLLKSKFKGDIKISLKGKKGSRILSLLHIIEYRFIMLFREKVIID